MGINDFVQIGDKIKKFRKSKGISQKEMAKKIGIPYSTYSNYENNNREPNTDTLIKITKELDISILELIDIDSILPSSEDLNKYRALLHTKTQKIRSNFGDIDDFTLHDIDNLICSTILEILGSASNSKSLNYSLNDFSAEEVDELSTFLFSAYKLKINEILDRNRGST